MHKISKEKNIEDIIYEIYIHYRSKKFGYTSKIIKTDNINDLNIFLNENLDIKNCLVRIEIFPDYKINKIEYIEDCGYESGEINK